MKPNQKCNNKLLVSQSIKLTLHLKTRPHFDVMTKRYEIIFDGKSHHTTTVIFWHWKKVLQNIHYLNRCNASYRSNRPHQLFKINKPENKTPFDLASPELSRLLRRVHSNG
ncbi:hypothetical protein T06_13344 [Trichinella sp. T6]|nr:hypothetical protein T06_13344 [Trichinella sp. T6]